MSMAQSVPAPAIDIIIVNWNSGTQLRDGLASRENASYSGPHSQDRNPLSLSCIFDFIRSWTALPRFCI
jgi:hypothetical protein